MIQTHPLAWIFAAIAATMPLGGSARAAGGAFVVDDVSVDDPGACKVESFTALAGNRDFIGASTPTCVVKLIRPTEISLQAARTHADGEWGTSLTPKFKMSLVPAATGTFGLAIEGGSTFDLRTGHNTGSFFFVPVTYTLSETFKVNVNGGWLHDRAKAQHFLSYGAGFEWVPFKPVTLIAEVYGIAGPKTHPRTITDPRFQAGIRVTPIDTVDVDLIYGRNITGENANWVTLGLNVRFSAPGK